MVAALIKGTDKERVVSEQYGGSGGDNASTDAVYAAIGNVSCLHKMRCLWFLPRKDAAFEQRWNSLHIVKAI